MKILRVLFSILFFASTMIITTAVMTVSTSDTVEAQTRPKKRTRRPRRRRARRPTSFAGFRTGLILTGPGNLSNADGDEVKFEDESTFGINGLAVFPIQNNIRGGASLWLFPGYEANRGSGQNDITGTMLHLNAIGEFVLPVNQVDGFAFAEAGVSLVLPDDDDVAESDFLGFNFGVGVGAQFLVSRQMAIRTDGKFEFYNVTNNDNDELTLSAQRIMLNVGVMFGL